MEKFTNLIEAAVRSQFSDFHITGGHPLVFRQNGKIQFDNRLRWSAQEVDALVRRMLNDFRLGVLRTRHSVDFALSIRNHRIRVNVFNTSRGLSLAVRLLSGKIPGIDELNLHPSIKDFTQFKSGLILICGPTGAGKSTTIAGLVKHINQSMAAHVITLEDPIEYRFKSDQAFVEQRELGAHFPSYERGLLDVLREDPDIIVVGELRETEAMRLTLDAAESGHLIIASMHAADVPECLYRFCNSFPLEVQSLTRFQLSTTLKAVMAQHLQYSPKHGFRIPLLSILRTNSAVAGLIRDNKFFQLETVMQMNFSKGMATFAQYQTDYLDRREDFKTPAWSLAPVSASEDAPYYESPLVNPEPLALCPDGLTKPVQRPPSPARKRPDASSAAPSDKQKESDPKTLEPEKKGYYYIEDSGSLQDVIDGLKNGNLTD
ncbi:MAG: ATPase, T2SS/T4P/T4SS family [Desulfobacterales bacterium]|nr:ATPase, T2SS/T4P/T4SS family [Desulfobacterales bacterium]